MGGATISAVMADSIPVFWGELAAPALPCENSIRTCAVVTAADLC